MTDHRSLTQWADLYYCGTTPEPYQGMPLGNGRTGSMVWLGTEAVNMQVNRVDVFATNGATTAGEWKMDSPDYYGANEYCGGCAGVQIDFEEEVFHEETRQILHMYDACLEISGGRVEADIRVWSEADVFVCSFKDVRQVKKPIRITLSMLRPELVERKNHRAKSTVSARGEEILLTQEFSESCSTGIRENDHFCASCVRAWAENAEVLDIKSAPGGDTAERAAGQIPGSITLTILPTAEQYQIFFASGASFSSLAGAESAAEQARESAKQTSPEEIRSTHEAWWHAYWEKSYIYTPDHPDFYRAWYTYLYYIGSTMRGDYPAKFNGLLFSTKGDVRTWGGQFWWYNQSRSHYGLAQANHGECNEPLFGMLLRNLPRYQKACEQQFGGNGGIYLPETEGFSGPEILPDEIARDLKNAFLYDAPATERLLAFMENRSGLNSRWAVFYSEVERREGGLQKFRWHSNLSYDAGDAGNSMLEQYFYLQDETFLKKIYPWLKGVAEFYRFHPCGEMEEGTYHIGHLGWAESVTYAKDVMDDVVIMKGIYPAVIRISEMLGIDEELREEWKHMAEILPPYPLSSMEDAVGRLNVNKDEKTGEAENTGGETFAIGRKPCCMMSEGNPNDCRLRVTFSYDLLNLETKKKNPREWETANRTLDALPVIKRLKQGIPSHADECGYSWNRILVAAAMLGRTDLIRECLPYVLRAFHMKNPKPTGEKYFPNRLPFTNGEESYSIQELGVFSDQMQAALLQSISDGPDNFDHVIHVVPAWPMEWDVSFELRAKGAFLVAADVRDGKLGPVKITSEKGKRCRIHNPWSGKDVYLWRKDSRGTDEQSEELYEEGNLREKEADFCGSAGISAESREERLRGETLEFDTRAGGVYWLLEELPAPAEELLPEELPGEELSREKLSGRRQEGLAESLCSVAGNVSAPQVISLDLLRTDRGIEGEYPSLAVGKGTILRMSDGGEAEYCSSDPEVLSIEGSRAYGRREGMAKVTAWREGAKADERIIRVTDGRA